MPSKKLLSVARPATWPAVAALIKAPRVRVAVAAAVVVLVFPTASLAVSQSPPKAVVGTGTINVVSIEPTTDKVSGNVSTGLGNYNYMEGSAALNVPEVKDALFKQGLDVAPESPEAFGAYIKSELDKWGKVVRDGKIKAYAVTSNGRSAAAPTFRNCLRVTVIAASPPPFGPPRGCAGRCRSGTCSRSSPG